MQPPTREPETAIAFIKSLIQLADNMHRQSKMPYTAIATQMLREAFAAPTQYEKESRFALASSCYLALAARDPTVGGTMISTTVMNSLQAVENLPEDEIDRALQVADRGFTLGQFIAQGRKVYEIAPALQERLLHTEVRGITCDMVRPQFKAFSIRVNPDLFAGVGEIFVSEVQGIGTEGGGEKFEESVKALDPLMFRSFRVCFYRRLEHKDTTDMGYFGIPLTKGYPFEDRVTEIESRLSEAAAGVARIVANVVLYLTWPDTGETFEERVSADYAALREKMLNARGNKREKLKLRLRALDPDRRIYVGAKVPFLSGQDTEAGAGDGKLFVRTLVAGHWKMQPCGEGRKDRKLIRIEPYWRGPLDGPESNPIRRVS